MNLRAFTALIVVAIIVLMVPIKLQSQDPETFCVLHNFGMPNSKDCGSLNLFDRPQLGTAYFDLGNTRVARAVVRDYAICGGVVQRQVTWITDQKLDANQQSHWTYQATFSSVTSNKIPDYFLCLLKNKGYDLPSGQTISAGVDCSHLPPAGLGKP